MTSRGSGIENTIKKLLSIQIATNDGREKVKDKRGPDETTRSKYRSKEGEGQRRSKYRKEGGDQSKDTGRRKYPERFPEGGTWIKKT